MERWKHSKIENVEKYHNHSFEIKIQQTINIFNEQNIEKSKVGNWNFIYHNNKASSKEIMRQRDMISDTWSNKAARYDKRYLK